jgi:hypothetical protein
MLLNNDSQLPEGTIRLRAARRLLIGASAWRLTGQTKARCGEQYPEAKLLGRARFWEARPGCTGAGDIGTVSAGGKSYPVV